MALVNSIFFQYGVPGVYVVEDTAGYIPASLATHNTAYMLGFSAKVDAPKNVPYFVTSPEDFYNVFGVSASAQSVQLFFDQRSGVGLYFVNVPTRKSRTIAVAEATVGGVYTVTVDGFNLSYTAVTGDTTGTILAALAAKVSSEAFEAARITDGEIRYDGAVITVSANLTLGTEVDAGEYPTVEEVVDSLNTSFTSENDQGYICAPEFFQALEDILDRAALARAMDTLCADPAYYWVAFADCGSDIANATTAGTAVLGARAERDLLASPKGHLAYYFPYLVNLANQQVPCSAAVIGLAIRRNRQQGFQQPPAGTQFPINGVKSVTVKVSSILQEQLNPKGINCVRHLPKDGIVAWGARTVSTNPYYRFVNTRVILNVLAGTLRGAFNAIIFSAVDGLGALFGRIKGTGVQICERLRKSGALYGATPEEAYMVICDNTNNPGIQLEEGIVALDVYVKPAPTLEVLGIRLVRTAIGQVFADLIDASTQPVGEVTETEA